MWKASTIERLHRHCSWEKKVSAYCCFVPERNWPGFSRIKASAAGENREARKLSARSSFDEGRSHRQLGNISRDPCGYVHRLSGNHSGLKLDASVVPGLRKQSHLA